MCTSYTKLKDLEHITPEGEVTYEGTMVSPPITVNIPDSLCDIDKRFIELEKAVLYLTDRVEELIAFKNCSPLQENLRGERE